MSNKLFVTVKNGNVEVGVGVTRVGACLEKGLNLQKQMTLRLEVFCEFEFAGEKWQRRFKTILILVGVSMANLVFCCASVQ